MNPKNNHDQKAGMTLVELLVALVLVAVMSVAVTALLTAAARTDSYARGSLGSQSEVELALKRITHNLQTAKSLASPASTTATGTLSLVTQPDPATGSSGYSVSYAVSGGNLVETDTRYGSNVLVRGTSTFTVNLVSGVQGKLVQIQLQTTGKPGVTRGTRVWCRNL